ncbi:MAG TPA: alpha/beta fold hydrolase [Thermoanaerobaculia bacterium]|nr:alpha/beta fold hydrolase [Thermoanaerobaculia bacterium]
MRRAPAFLLLIITMAVHADDQKFASLGDFPLENGETIRDCRIGYRTAGVLNADRSNVLVVLTWFGGNSAGLAPSIGPGKLFDTDRWFVVTIDALGDGVSSSPSNSATQPGARFPKFTMRDMVRTQHALLTRELKLSQVHGVAGLSMGGMQALQWPFSYPQYMKKVVSITGTPRQMSHDLILWKTQLELLESFSGSPAHLREVMEALAGINMLELWTPSWMAKNVKASEVDERMATHRASLADRNAFDYMSQLRAMIGHDVGPLEEAAKTLRAELLMIVALQDEMVNPGPSRELARVTGARIATLSSDCGHLAPGCEPEVVAREVARFLAP